MWPLSVLLLFVLQTPQQNAAAPGQDFRTGKLPQFNLSQSTPQQQDFLTGKLPAFKPAFKIDTELRARRALKLAADEAKSAAANTCFTMRSYVFHREDGQAPKLVDTTTCTPANTLRTLQTSPAPPVRFVPVAK